MRENAAGDLPAPILSLTYASTEAAPAIVLQSDGSVRATTTFDDTPQNRFPIDGFTVGLWLSSLQSDPNAVLISYGPAASDNTKLLRICNPGNLAVQFGADGTGATGLSWNDGHWHHLAVVVAPADRAHYSVAIYRDGALVWKRERGLTFAAGASLPPAGVLTLGGGGAAPAIGYVGQASELQLWARALDRFAIATWVQRRAVAGTPLLTRGWPLDKNPPGNSIPPQNFVASTLRFRIPDQGAADFVLASWPAVTGAVSYDLQVAAETGDWTFTAAGMTPTQVPVAVPGVLLGRKYRGRARAVDGSGPGPWCDPVELAPLNLQPLVLDFTWPDGGTLAAEWLAVDQAQTYDLALYQGNSTVPTLRLNQAATSYPLADRVDLPDAWRVLARGLSVVPPWTFGSSGPASQTSAIDRTPLGFYYLGQQGAGTGDFEFDWTPDPTAAFFLLEVTKDGQTIVRRRVPGSTVPPVKIPPPGQVIVGEQYVGRLRRIGAGVLSEWDQKTVGIHQLGQPILQYQAASPPAAEALQITWGSVSPGATYNLTVLTDGGNPVHHDNVTSPYNVTSLLANSQSEAENHAYTFKVQAVQEGEIGPPNDVVTPPSVTLTFLYTYGGGSDPGVLRAAWTPATGLEVDVYLRVFQDGAATPSLYVKAPIAQATYDVAPPAGGFQNNAVYSLQLRPMAQGTLASALFGQVRIHRLSAPAVAIVQTAPGQPQIQAQWAAIDPDVQPAYQVQINNALVGPPQPGLTYDLTTYLNQPGAVEILVRGVKDQSLGPWSVAGVPPALQPDARYVLAASGSDSLTVRWQAAPFVYVNVLRAGQTAPAAQQIISDGVTRSLSVPAPAGGFQEGDTYTSQEKSAAAGVLGAFQTQQVVIHKLAQPAPRFPATNTPSAVMLAWTDIRTPAQQAANVQVSYLIAIDGAAVGTPQSSLAYDLTSRVTQDASIAVTVQGTADNSYGIISQPPALAVPAIGTFTYDADAGTVSVAWPAVVGAEAYYLDIKDTSNGSVIASRWINANSQQTFLVSVAQRLQAHAYLARVRALAGGTLSAFGSSTLTVYDLAGPSALTLTPTFATQSIQASWQFDAQSLPAVSYTAELRDQNAALLDTQSVTAKTAVLHYPQGTSTGTTLTVRVRAVMGGDSGPWSQPQTITVGSDLAQPVITGASVDEHNTITVTWNVVAGSNVRYDLTMTGPGLDPAYTRTAISGTRVALAQSDTRVQENSTYSIRVRASQPAPAGPWSDPRSVTTNKLQPPDHGSSPGSGSQGDPVVLATGWYSYSNVDILVVGASPLQFITYYNTFTNLPDEDPPGPDRPLGARWNHAYNTRLAVSADGKTLAVLWGTGVIAKYDVPASVTGVFTKQGLHTGDVLIRLADLTYQLTTPDQTMYVFDAAGSLRQIVDPAGNPVDLTYTAGRLSRVTDRGSSRYLELTYFTAGANDGRIRQITDNAGRSITYDYVDGNLTTFTDVQAKTRLFTYSARSLMHTASDQEGNVFITNTYDANRRVIQQKDARAVERGEDYFTRFDYEELTQDGFVYLKTTVTDRLGFVSVYVSNKVTRNTVSEVHNLANGQVWRVLRAFDGFGAVLSETVYQGDPSGAANLGNTTRYQYDGDGNLLSTTDPLGQQQTFTYDNRNNVTSYVDTLGNVTRVAYVPGTSLVQEIARPSGSREWLDYRTVGNGIRGLPERITVYPNGQSPRGNVTTLDYYTTGERRLWTNALGESVEYAYDDRNTGWLTSMKTKDANGAIVREIAITPWPATGLTKDRTQQFAGQQAADAFVTSFAYDGLGLLTSLTNPLLRQTTYHYDPNGFLSSVVYPVDSGNPQSTQYGYDRDDRRTSITYSAAAPHVATGAGYDEIGRQTSFTDGNGRVTTRTYAMDLRPAGTPCPTIEVTTYPPVDIHYPDGRTVTVTYARRRTLDAIGVVIEETDLAPVGSWGPSTTYDYSVVAAADGNQLKIVTTLPKDPLQPAPYTTTTILDDALRPVSFTNERGKTWTTTRASELDPATNTMRSVETTTDPLGVQSIIVTDAVGRVVARKVGQGTVWRETTVAYDPLNRPLRIDEPDPANAGATVRTTIDYQYDAETHSLVMRVSPYQAPASRYFFDGAGQWVQYIDAHGTTVRFTFTASGQLLTCANNRAQTLTYGYDAAGRFISTTRPDIGLVEHVLDGNGNRLQTRVAGAAALTRTFDALNRLTSRQETSTATTVTYTYNAMSAVDTLTYTNLGGAVAFDYDVLNQMSAVTDWRGRRTRYTYYPTGQLLSATSPGGVHTAYAYDDANRFTGLQSTIGADVVVSIDYMLDALGNPQQAERILPLAPAPSPGVMRFTYSSGDRLDTVNDQPVGYDADGNITAVPGSSDALTYDVFNLLSRAGADVSYGYDPDGLRTSLVRSGATTRYVHDIAAYQNPAIEQADPIGGVQSAAPALFAGGPSGLVPHVATDVAGPNGSLSRVLSTFAGDTLAARYVWGMGLIGQELADGTYRSAVFDDVGNTLALVDSNGAVTDRFAYTPYGAPAGRVGTTDIPFLLHGRYGVMTDPNGLAFMRARTYDAGLRRFLSKDFLIGDLDRPQTLNRYAFVTGDPVRLIDPLGLSGDRDSGGFWTWAGRVAAGLGVLAGVVAAVGAALYFGAPAAFTAGLTAGGTGASTVLSGSLFQRAAFSFGRTAGRIVGRNLATRWAAYRTGSSYARMVNEVEMETLSAEGRTVGTSGSTTAGGRVLPPSGSSASDWSGVPNTLRVRRGFTTSE